MMTRKYLTRPMTNISYFKTMVKPVFLICSLFIWAVQTIAQVTTDYDSAIAQLQAINRDIWTPFSEAYASADAEKYISLHSPDFIRASGGDHPEIFNLNHYAENSRTGFQRGKEQGFKTRIRFAFIERVVSAAFASERGIYHYHSENGKGQVYDGYGKFHVVERFENGRWKILFDYDSNENGTIDKADFDAAYAPGDWMVLTKSVFDLKTIRQHIETANLVYGERFNTGDTSWYAARYTRDACILPDNAPRICGLAEIAGFNFNKGENRGLGIRIHVLEISGGPETVVEEGLFENFDAQNNVLSKGKFIATWGQEDGLWKLRREIWNADAPGK